MIFLFVIHCNYIIILDSQEIAPIPIEHSYIVPTGQPYYQSGQQPMYPVGQYGHEIYG